MLHETWKDRDDVLQVQLHRPYRAEWHAALEEMLERPREIQVWRPLRADGVLPGLVLFGSASSQNGGTLGSERPDR